MAAEPAESAPPPEVEVGLQPGAIGFVDALVIGLASTSPAYSLAAIIGALVALTGVNAPGVLLASFVPMLLIAAAFAALNRVDPDCGTTFSWVTRAMGPWLGWLGGWAITMTGILIVGSLANVAVIFTLLTLGLDGLAENTVLVLVLTVAVILLMTWICVLGTELSAHVQNGMILAQTVALLVFATVALVRGVSGNSPLGGLDPAWNWLNPFGAGGAALTGGLLLGVFAYWGWESAVNLTEETRDSTSAPGRAAVLSTVILLVTYVGVAIAVLAFAGIDYLSENEDEEEAIFALLSTEVMGGWDWVVLLAVATSALASTQTTVLPASRTGLSMARRHALPRRFGHIDPRHRTPDVSTWWVGGIASVWFVAVSLLSENAIFDTVTALSLLIAFYYALTGLACAVYNRRLLTRSVRSFLLIGVGPVVGALLLAWLLVESIRDIADPENSYTGQAWLGVGPPLVIGVGIFVVGVVLMFVWRARDRTFWQERPSVAPDPAARPGGRPMGRERQRPRSGSRSESSHEPVMSIVLGYDESPGSRPALAMAISLAERYAEPLVLVYGVEPPGGVGEEFQAHQRALAELGRTAVAHAVEEAAAAGVRTVVEVLPEKPAQALIDAAHRHDGRVIVVGIRGESPLRSAFLGSVSHKLLHLSDRPVLCVPA